MLKRHLAGLTVAALVAGGGAAAWAAAPAPADQTPSPQSAGQQQPAGRAQHRSRAGLAERAVHGDLIVRAKGGYQKVTLDRGSVQAKGDNTITLKRPDGPTVTVKVDPNTRYRGISSFGDLQAGRPAIVVSHDGTALMVAQRSPGRNNPGGSNVGGDEEQVPAT